MSVENGGNQFCFRLVPLLSSIPLSDKINGQLESMDISGQSLYIGTRDSFVVEFKFDASKRTCQRLQLKYLGTKKPITVIKAVPSVERVLCVCDGTLIILNSKDLDMVSYGSSKIRSVTTIAVNEQDYQQNPFGVEIVIARRKSLYHYNLNDDNLTMLREISLESAIVSIAMDGIFVCVGTEEDLSIVNLGTDEIQSLCRVSREERPIVKRVTDEEFLISGIESLGLFVKASGTSERPPIRWEPNVLGIIFYEQPPYVICLYEKAVRIYSAIDQRLKQSIDIGRGLKIEKCGTTVVMANADSSLCILEPIAWEDQLELLLKNKMVEEALELSEKWHGSSLSRESFKQISQRTKQKAAFIYFAQQRFTEARQLFIDSQIDVRELLSLYPGLLTKHLSYVRVLDPLHDIHDIIDLSLGEESSIRSYRKFLFKFLSYLRENECEAYQAFPVECDTSLVLVALDLRETDSKPNNTVTKADEDEISEDQIARILMMPDLQCDRMLVTQRLQEKNLHNLLAIFYASPSINELDKACEIWLKLDDGQLKDRNYRDLEKMARALRGSFVPQLILKWVPFILKKNQKLAASIFVDRPEDDPLFTAERRISWDDVIQVFSQYSEALIVTLEHIVFVMKDKSEKFHTSLATFYLDNALQCLQQLSKPQEPKPNLNLEEIDLITLETPSPDSLDPFSRSKQWREKLQKLIKFSDELRIQFLLSKTMENKFSHESAILFGKLGEHDRALRVLVFEANDYQAAKLYCEEQNDPSLRSQLYHNLLAIYLDKSHSYDLQKELKQAALDLLNDSSDRSASVEFDAIKVINILPNDCRVDSIAKFLISSISRLHHRSLLSMFQANLMAYRELEAQREKIDATTIFTVLTEERVCANCGKNFGDADFVWFSEEEKVSHTHCHLRAMKGLKS